MLILPQIGLTFDDVLLMPRRLEFSSRFNGEIDLSTSILPNVHLTFPIVSANMDTVTNTDMAQAMQDLGGIGIVHRFMDPTEHRNSLTMKGPKVVCIGVGQRGIGRLDHMTSHLPIDGVLIDVAHGHSDAVLEQIRTVKQKYEMSIIAGNVATVEGARALARAGADCIKVGVGPGSLCTTRMKTGNGVPQLTAIMNAAEGIAKAGSTAKLIADGGIKNAGDIVKALAAGADAVMIGNLFAGTSEAPGELFSRKGGQLVKRYRGMASREAQKDWKGSVSSVEGEIASVPFKGDVKPIFNELISGILSGMSYQNAKNLAELKKNAVFMQQTQAGYKESLPHGL